MKKWNYLSGTGYAVGDDKVIIPGGQLLDVSVVAPPENEVYFRIGNKGLIYVPAGTTFEIGARELGACCGDTIIPEQWYPDGRLKLALIRSELCNQFPGEMPITLEFGVWPDGEPRDAAGPLAWFVAWEGGCP